MIEIQHDSAACTCGQCHRTDETPRSTARAASWRDPAVAKAAEDAEQEQYARELAAAERRLGPRTPQRVQRWREALPSSLEARMTDDERTAPRGLRPLPNQLRFRKAT